MPEKETIERARKDKAQGKSPSTQAGEFVREEIRHVRQGKHGVRSARQAIAIGLSKARRAGVDLKPPGPGRASPESRKRAEGVQRRGQKEGPLSDRAPASRPKRPAATPHKGRSTTSQLKPSRSTSHQHSARRTLGQRRRSQ